jgi:prephenate dehydrogenase
MTFCYPWPVKTVAVIGCGLIGGSIVQSLRRSGRASRLLAVDREPVLSVARSHLDAAAEPGTPQARDLVREADLVVLAVPVFAIIQNLDWVLDAIGDDAVVTDTGSVKKPILAAARSHPRGARFVAGHPMAGRETGGFEAATADLFEGSRWFLVAETSDGARAPDKTAVDRVVELAEAVGAEPMVLDAEAHDRAMAYVSHVPQLIASALYGVAARAGVLGEAGPGFRDLTRIAGGPPSVWRDIFESNRQEIAGALAHILEPLIDLRNKLAAGDDKALDAAIALLERVHEVRNKKPAVDRSAGERES